ncbi:MAG: hypothetical protein ABSC95_28240 [Acetobacteraceae bacterium]|jgi:hypothetical protein
MLQVVCVGASHLHSLRHAYALRQRSGEIDFAFKIFQLLEDRYKPGYTSVDGQNVFNENFGIDFQEYLETSKPSAVFTYLGGAEHALLSLTKSPRPFDFYIPGEDVQPDLNSEIIPYDLMLATCRYRVSNMSPWFPHLRSFTKLPLYQVGPPPPIAGDDHITLQADPVFSEAIARYGVAPARLRAKVWEVCNTAMRRVCEENLVHFVAPIAEARDADGCLLLQYRSHDALHANAAYGDLMLDRIVQIARERRDTESI